FAFSGFAALAPVMLAALFWKRSTKWGALAATVWVVGCVFANWHLTNISDAIAPKPPKRPAASAMRGGPATGGGPGAGAPELPGGLRGAAPGAQPGGTPQVTGEGPTPAPAGLQTAQGGAPGGAPEGMRPTGPGAGGPGGPGGKKKPPTAVRIFPQLGDMFLRGPVNVTIYGFLPVFPMVVGSALLMLLVSLITPPPSKATIDKYFSK
ncbi:MAG: hypothetical protein RL169_796, partial [Armatimonadota bacterium]